MTLNDLKAFDVSAAWARLTPEAKAAIGEAAIAWQLAALVSERAASAPTTHAAGDMADDAHNALADAVEAALPDIHWQPENGA